MYMVLKRIEDLHSAELSQVTSPFYAIGQLKNASSGYAKIRGFDAALESCTDPHGPWGRNRREQGFDRLCAEIEQGGWVLVLDKSWPPISPAFHQVDGHWEITRDVWQNGPRHRFTAQTQTLQRLQCEQEALQSRNRPPAPQQIEPVTGPGNRRAALGPHLSQPPAGRQALPTAAASESRPELEAIANDPAVKAEIDKTWAASNPYGVGASKQEQGFWVLRDNKTGVISVQQFPSNGTRDSLRPGPVPAGAAAFFHTHPNTAAEGYSQEPSPADVRFANSRGIPGIIQSHDGMYYFGPPLP